MCVFVCLFRGHCFGNGYISCRISSPLNFSPSFHSFSFSFFLPLCCREPSRLGTHPHELNPPSGLAATYTIQIPNNKRRTKRSTEKKGENKLCRPVLGKLSFHISVNGHLERRIQRVPGKRTVTFKVTNMTLVPTKTCLNFSDMGECTLATS